MGARLQDFNGARLLTASPAGTPYTDLLVERFAASGANVTPVEARVTGGPQLLTDLVETDSIAAMPSGTASPNGVHSLTIPGFTFRCWCSGPLGDPLARSNCCATNWGAEPPLGRRTSSVIFNHRRREPAPASPARS